MHIDRELNGVSLLGRPRCGSSGRQRYPPAARRAQRPHRRRLRRRLGAEAVAVLRSGFAVRHHGERRAQRQEGALNSSRLAGCGRAAFIIRAPCFPPATSSPIASTGRPASGPPRSCPCRARKWRRSAGTAATSSSSPATPTSTTRASAWRSSAACWRRRASASASSRSPTGAPTADFARLGRPNLFFGITAGNMDSMVNRYTSDRRIRSDDAYTPGGAGRQAAGSLGDRVRAARARSVQRRADRHRRHRGEPAPHRALRLLVGESAPLDPARCEGRPARLRQRASGRSSRSRIGSRRASASTRSPTCAARRSRATRRRQGWTEIDSTTIDEPGQLNPPVDPYAMEGAKHRDGRAGAAQPCSTPSRSRAAAGRRS